MEESFRKIVEHVFSNWTALQLAVEHGMAGPNSQQVAKECLDYMVQYCIYEPNVQVTDIEEALEDVLDQEFETICEDSSPKEIACVLHQFLSWLKNGNMEQFELEYNNLPINRHTGSKQLQQPASQQPQQQSVSIPTTSNVVETPMEEDSEWTEVKSRRKR